MTGRQSRAGWGWAYVGVVLGAGVSVAANVAASFIPPYNPPVGWEPEPGAVVSAVFWPVLVLVAVELFARIAWPAGWRWLLLRAAGVLPVAVIAAIVSYRHLSRLLRFYGEDPLTSTLGPLAVDGLMVMAAGALLAGRATPDQPSAPEPPDPPRPVPAVPARRGTGPRSDAVLIEAVKRVRRDPDGTVPVRRAAKALGTGPDRARRLLAEAGLLRTHPADQAPGASPVRVPDPPVAAVVGGRDGDRL